MKESSYIIIRAEVDNVKVITKKTNNEEVLEILNKGEFRNKIINLHGL